MNNNTFPMLALLLGGLMLFSACLGDPPKNTQRTNKLNIRLESEAKLVNPLLGTTAYSRYVAEDVFQTMAIFDPETIELVPVMINSIPTLNTLNDNSPKGKYAYTFELRDAAKWDNGDPITAKDVEFSLKLVFHPLLDTKIWRSYFDRISHFEIAPDNPKKFTVYFKEYYFLALESMCQLPIYPAYHYDPQGLLSTTPLTDFLDPKKVEALSTTEPMKAYAAFFSTPELSTDKLKINGSGPYKVAFFDPSQGAVLVKKDNWWGATLGASNPKLAIYPDTLNYILVKAEDAAINMLRSGALDIASNIKTSIYLELQKDTALSAKYDFVLSSPNTYSRVMINNQDPILSDINVRKALTYAVNYEEMLNTIQSGVAERTQGPFQPSSSFYAKDIPLPQFDTEQVKKWLALAGWADTDNDGVADKVINGKKTNLTLDYQNTTGGVSDQITASLQQSFTKAGIQLNFKPVTAEAMRDITTSGNFQLASGALALHAKETDFSQIYHSKSLAPKGDNRNRIANPELDRVLDQIATNPDIAQRKQLAIQLQQILNDLTPELYLYAPKIRLVVSKDFTHQFTLLRPGYVPRLAKLKQ